MDSNNNKTRHVSRLKKEMYEQRLKHNPFSSPPSSTGSHDTVSTTTEELTNNASAFSFSPDGEGTRKFSAGAQAAQKKASSKFSRTSAAQPKTIVNTSALARAFPEWSGLVNGEHTTLSKSITTGSLPLVGAGKENIPPLAEDTMPEDHTFDHISNSKRKRAEVDLQPRVEDESDCSTVLSRTPRRPVGASRASRFARDNTDDSISPQNPRPALQGLASKMRGDQKFTADDKAAVHSPSRMPSHHLPILSQHVVLSSPAANQSGLNPTGRSFFLPSFNHLPDWTSGTLKFSSMRNGVPVFVKSSRARSRLGQSTEHHSIHGVDIPEEDEEIFVSMDKLQEEVRELHDHDEMLQRETERLQAEIIQLQSELAKFKARKSSDSALGSESDNLDAGNHRLEVQINQLQQRLDEANRQVGVHDIHGAALTAERDEALHQASVARERAQKLHAELEAMHRDLEVNMRYRGDHNSNREEIISLRNANETLRKQHEVAIQSSQTLITQHEQLRQDFTALQQELASVREELSALRRDHQALLDEKRNISQDHVSMERQNETFFKENKRLQKQISLRDQHIVDLKKGIDARDNLLNSLNDETTPTEAREHNAALGDEFESLKQQLHDQSLELDKRDAMINTKEGKIRVLREKNIDLSRENQDLLKENQRLSGEVEEMREQWKEECHKVTRLTHLLSKNNTDYIKAVTDNTQDCLRLEEDFKAKEAAFSNKVERRDAAIKKVKQLTNRILAEIQQDVTATITKPLKATRIVEPTRTLSEGTVRSSAYIAEDEPVDDDPTTELNMSQGSDFASILDGHLDQLKQVYRDIHSQKEEHTGTRNAGNTAQLTECSLPPLPPIPVMRRTKSDDSLDIARMRSELPKTQPVGILKKPSRFATEEDTGRFSVKSGLSVVSAQSVESSRSLTSMQQHRVSKSSTIVPSNTRPESRLRRQVSDPGPVEEVEETMDRNMTSAFILPDITLQSEKKNGTTAKTGPSLSKDARRVLDRICKHKSGNCTVCTRISSFAEQNSSSATSNKVKVTFEELKKGKKTVRVDKPVPVSDRFQETDEYSEEPTVRPAMPPGEALAMLIKETQDEIDHLEIEIREVQELYFRRNKSTSQRKHRSLMVEIQTKQREVERKRGHMYKLHDVLEGQKQAGQLMTQEELEMTVMSLLQMEATVESKEGSWQGFEE